MKKIVSMLLISAMLVTALTACNTDNTSSDSANNSTSNVSSDNSTSSVSSDNSASDVSSDISESTPENSDSVPESSSDGEIIVPDDPNNPGDGGDDGENEGVDNSGLPFPDNKAGELAKAALATDAWPAMDLVSDPEVIPVMISPDLNVDAMEEYCFATNFISAQLNKVVVVKPKADNETEVSEALDAYFENVTTDPNIVFYPAQEESAKGAVKGKTDDGYYYIIVHENGADIESAMLEAV